MFKTSNMKNDLARNNPYMKMMVNILRAGKIIDHKVSEVLKEFGITHIQFNLLRILEASMPRKLSLSELQDGLLFPTSDVSRLLDRLVKRGLIDRSTCPDNRRKIDVHITAEGLEVIRKAIPRIEKSLNGYYRNDIDESERLAVIDIMKRIK